MHRDLPVSGISIHEYSVLVIHGGGGREGGTTIMLVSRGILTK